jgi:predicted negative regulator of RcsB-dependent stress response
MACASARAMLARAAGEAGDAELFDASMDAYRRLLDQPSERGMFGNLFTLREIELRGLVGTGRAHAAARLMAQPHDTVPAAPQWAVIEHVTTGQVLLAIGDHDGARHALMTAITQAENYQLPHQIQRAVRLADGDLPEVATQGRAAIVRLDQQLSGPP